MDDGKYKKLEVCNHMANRGISYEVLLFLYQRK